jgi:hypothetical protein
LDQFEEALDEGREALFGHAGHEFVEHAALAE